MALNRYKLSQLIIQRREKYNGIEELPIRGVSRDGFINPKQENADLSIYNVFYENDFVFNPARMELNSIALNTEIKKGICSSLYEVFYVSKTDILLPEYLNIFIKRDEFARRCSFEAIGSARNYFRTNNLGEFEIDLPSIEVQKKYVDIYKAMQHNLSVYESKLDDLKLVCDGFIEQLKLKYILEPINDLLIEKRVKNDKCELLKNKCVSNSKTFIDAKEAIVSGVDTRNYLVVEHNEFAYNTVTTRNGDKLSIALNSEEKCLVSPLYTTFKVLDNNKLLPDYLNLWFRRDEYDRFARFESWGSARELFPFETLSNTRIPLPPIDIQNSIVNVFNAYNKRKQYVEILRDKISNIGPILIAGAMKEAR